MTQMRYARPRLITADDQHYRAFVAQFILQRQNQRAMRPPRQRDIFGGQAEAALRHWLADQLPLAERRILEYEERRGKRASTKYRELDALVIDDRSAWVFEIKASRTAGSLRRAAGQLQETRAILRLLYPRVYTTILLVDTGMPTADEIAALMAGPEAPRTPPPTLDEVLATQPEIQPVSSIAECQQNDQRVDLLRFSVDDIIALAGAENLALDWTADAALADTPPPPPDSEPVYSTEETDSDVDESPLAAALRRAGLKDDNG